MSGSSWLLVDGHKMSRKEEGTKLEIRVEEWEGSH
jgi:hypothetical protein